MVIDISFSCLNFFENFHDDQTLLLYAAPSLQNNVPSTCLTANISSQGQASDTTLIVFRQVSGKLVIKTA